MNRTVRQMKNQRDVKRSIINKNAVSFFTVFPETRFQQSVEIKMIIVEIKSVVQTEARVQHRRPDHSGSRVSMLLENRGHRWLSWIQFVRGEVMNAAEHRISAGEDHGMRW